MRAGMAVRSSSNTVKSRKEYFSQNWDTLLVRTLLVLPVYWVDQNPVEIGGWIHKPIPFKIPDGLLAVMVLGFFSNAIIDWFSSLETIPFTKWQMPKVIRDNIPLFPTNGKTVPAQNAKQDTK
jgi:hypothetical protein